MDPHSHIPSFEIPKNAEKNPVHIQYGEVDPSLRFDASHETLPAPHMPTHQPMQPIPVQQNMTGQPMQQVAMQPAPMQAGHLIADDADVIEKEWVERAKKVVMMTKHDPHLESRELSRLKATYMKQRFNKDLPLEGNTN